MTTTSPRVRFAPSPSGFMHLGNVRAALLNYLFARQERGTFILRIEDTDASRTTQEHLATLLDDLSWLRLGYDEGPLVEGSHTPYFQSQRQELYQRYLELFKAKGFIYRCFMTPEELEALRKSYELQKLPPRYNRAGLTLSPEQVDAFIAQGKPFVWRFKLPEGTVQIVDKARGTIQYDLAHFADFAITRQDGSFTFVFANFVDDVEMGITHIIRGEDHLSNTALQAALYTSLGLPVPHYYHLPIICNSEGKKLSKRDFGFSLQDLRLAGFLSEAITNYLAIIGGSFSPEIMSREEMINHKIYDRITSTGTIQYDLDKLRWINHEWIKKLSIEDLTQRALPFLEKAFGSENVAAYPHLDKALTLTQGDFFTLADIPEQLEFCFQEPTASSTEEPEAVRALFHILAPQASELSPLAFIDALKNEAKKASLPLKDLFGAIRTRLTGNPHGIGIADLCAILPEAIIKQRLTP